MCVPGSLPDTNGCQVAKRAMDNMVVTVRKMVADGEL